MDTNIRRHMCLEFFINNELSNPKIDKTTKEGLETNNI